MGNSSSKQPAEDALSPEDQASTTSTSNAQIESEQPLSEHAMQEDATATASLEAAKEAEPIVVDTEAAKSTQDGGDSFKIPSLPTSTLSAAPEQPLSPNSTTMKALPADIEHILSLGANQDELAKIAKSKSSAGGSGEIDQVVKELREKYEKEGQEQSGKDAELSQVEREMKEKGVLRNEGNVISAEDQMDQDSDGNDSSSSDSDSDDSSAMESDSTSRDKEANPTQQTKAARKRRKPVPADSGDEDGDSDSGIGGGGSAPKTEHELAEPEPSLPEVMKIDESAEIARFGKVESVIETVVVVKADTSGDWRVLDEGTVVCWEDKTVIGAIFETFGSVQQPFYSLRFPANSPPDPSVFTLQKPVFYAPSHAQFVFTRDLRSLKGSDASNVWDEEVGAGEVEFSDDEEEAEYKKRLKMERKARKESATPGPSSRQQSRAPSNMPRSPPSRAPPAGHPSLPARPSISYADTEEPVASTSTASSSSVFDMYGPPVPVPPTSKSGPKVEMGDKPPPGRIGRKMFERDTGRGLEDGEQVEFEFSDGEGDDSSNDSEDESMKDGRKFKGDASQQQQRESGRGRGRGRGGSSETRGRGRGRGGGQDRGGGRGRGARGGRGGGRGGERHVAPLPARASPQRGGGGNMTTGLPPRPQFELPEGATGGSEERMSIDASQAPAFAPPIRFGEPTAFGGAYQSRSPPNQSRPPPRQQPLPPSASSSQGYNPQMPSSSYPIPPSTYPNPNAYYRAPPPMHAPQQAYYPMPSPAAPSSGGAYSPHQPQAAFIQPSAPSAGTGSAASGHVNPRFLAQQQQQQQGGGAGGGMPSGQSAQYPQGGAYPGMGGYGSYGGYGYGGGYGGGYGQGQEGQGR
ncbi:H/ACA ribonucleoprotein complex subunit GAR1/NAF1 [Sporobolomyces salmoneus]|uniref:H/ACA ribonucleoprotein complex subunit GAR1/NAF1 n=1 Tax=Sporobolomyces salmoneus TaxID=183962 RepID=UPI00316B1EC8